MIELSIIIPAYNAGAFLEDTLQRLQGVLGEDRELIVVDDGSSDNTFEIMERFRSHIPNYQAIRLPQNKGKGYAVREGMKRASGSFVAFTDADLPYGLAVFDGMLAQMKSGNASFLYGSRSHEASQEKAGYGAVRRIGRVFFSVLIRLLAVPEVKDTQCGIKMFKRALAVQISEKGSVNRFASDIEYFVIAEDNGLQFQDFPVELSHRKESSVRLVRDTLLMLKDVIGILIRHLKGRYV